MLKPSQKHSTKILASLIFSAAALFILSSMVFERGPKMRPVVFSRTRPQRRTFYTRFGKRVLDLLISITALLVFAPVMLVVAILVRQKLGTPVIFRQERPGHHGKSFMMYKFRTMTNATDASGNLLPDAQRITPFGRFLRRSSLDELPELFNVIKGEMSVVGPRPLLMKYLDRYTPEQFRRHDEKPGITGWAQINGRNAISWEEKFAYDVWYVDHCSLWLDIKIIFLTALKVFKKEGISAAGYVSAPEFKGTKKD